MPTEQSLVDVKVVDAVDIKEADCTVSEGHAGMPSG